MPFVNMRRRAQGMTEYIIIVILIALAVVVAVNAFSQTVDKKYVDTGKELQDQVRP